ncbi:TIGR02147 family protein [Bdellovibrio bacteriovorus]|uniref:TIGR02147 family protein n=1 Tax=Bdellovibrio bacteriovorus TaxID=959 RepID=UPI0035A6035B
MKRKSLDIFDYHDYREFLRDWFDHARESQSLSLRDIAEKCGLSTGYLPMILAGKRNLSEKSFLKLQEVLKLNQEEAHYFRSLLILSDDSKSQDRLHAFAEIRKSRSFRQKNPKELEVYQYLANWLHVTIREMAHRRDFQADPTWIQARLVYKASLKEIENSLNFLLEQGFLVRTKSGMVIQSQKQLDCFSGVYRLSLGEFHKQMFRLAAESIDATPRDQRNLLGHTFVIPEDQIESLRRILDDTLKKVEALSSDFQEAGPVYHVILSTFPVAKKGDANK